LVIVRQWASLFVTVLLAGACAARTPRVLPPAPPSTAPPQVVVVAESLIGTPYRTAGTTPDGFDCSGFTQYVYRDAGIALPRSVLEQYALGAPVGRDEIRAGDLVFFAIDGTTVSHVGLAVGPDRFVHAPSSRGYVREESLSISYWDSRFRGARRLTAG
jgi:cell wall-associated NlpC family hydrolase